MECIKVRFVMNIFVDYTIKRIFVIISTILLCFILMTQFIINLTTNKYKRDIIKHYYIIAGYLYEHDVDIDKIENAFTVNQDIQYYAVGEEILNSKGYTENISNDLLPEFKNSHNNFYIMLLVSSVFMSLCLLFVLFIFFIRQDRKFEKANMDILSFMYENKDIRLSDDDEGRISQLFSSINQMATSLATHIVNEKRTKDFLKNTISDISHQLKTPLTALKMYNEIIRAENINNDVVYDFITKSEDQLERMDYLIQSLLKLARLDADAIQFEKKNCYIKDLLEDIVVGFSARAKLENKIIKLTCNNNIVLNCDRDWMMEAISNIVKNSLDHMHSENEVQIVCDETPVLIYLIIKDNGSGIHPEDIHYIFKRFYRSRFSKDKNGIGIGLTLAKNIIEKNGGSIEVKSILNKGTTLYMTFPKLTNL